MSETFSEIYDFSFAMIDIKKIDPSPYQHRKYFDEERLKELGASILQDGLIEPIVVMPQKNSRYQLIAGERRLKAVKEYTHMTVIQAKIARVDDFQARRISAAENSLRENLSAIETIEDSIEIIDAQLSKDAGYMTVAKTPLKRVHKLLSDMDSARRSMVRGSSPGQAKKQLSHKFMGQLEFIFKNLPKPLEWRSFLNNDLSLLLDIHPRVQDTSIKHGLNKAQTKALANLELTSKKVFHDIIQKTFPPLKRSKLKECSAKEIQAFAKLEDKTSEKKDASLPKFSTKTKIAIMASLGIPIVRISSRLNVHRETISRYIKNNNSLFETFHKEFEKGLQVPDIAKKYSVPQPLVWSVVLKEKTDQKRFLALNWGLRTWDNWNFNDVDKRFGDNWPGRIPAQLIGHTLFYFTRQNDLVLDPMAGGGVVPDTCLAFNRRCWSFDLSDRKSTRPEIESFLWDPEHLAWPLPKIGVKPDLIFFDPPYFTKKAKQYSKGSISDFSRPMYLKFFKNIFSLMKKHSKHSTRIAFLNADFRDFQGTTALKEPGKNAILMLDYMKLLEESGWEITHLIDCPLSSERFTGNMVHHMQQKRTLGVVRRTLIMGRLK